ncbi:MAG: DUF3450 domain-containing protein [Symploca sp. SIO2E9]|nr:DUF3450 domain-containing protein [Symploca sp. SIO2E9]
MAKPLAETIKPSTVASSYRPSVPISVYRELAAELHIAQARLESLNNQNQHLVKQNQQLRQEVEKVVKSAQHLQQVVASLEPVSKEGKPRDGSTIPSPSPPIATAPLPRNGAATPEIDFSKDSRQPNTVPSPYGETLVIEQEEERFPRSNSSEGSSDVSGWLLIVVIIVILLTAFGSGFLLVKWLSNSNR